jgi:hypothetical protein
MCSIYYHLLLSLFFFFFLHIPFIPPHSDLAFPFVSILFLPFFHMCSFSFVVSFFFSVFLHFHGSYSLPLFPPSAHHSYISLFSLSSHNPSSKQYFLMFLGEKTINYFIFLSFSLSSSFSSSSSSSS